MNKVTIARAQQHHAYDLHRRLRGTDRQELAALTDESPLDVLLQSVDLSSSAWAAVRNGHCQALFGVAPMVPGLGSIWLLASDDIYNFRRDFMRYCRKYLARMHEDYPVLTNFIDDRNRTAQAWLRRLGFKPGTRYPKYGIARLPFTQYTSVR